MQEIAHAKSFSEELVPTTYDSIEAGIAKRKAEAEAKAAAAK